MRGEGGRSSPLGDETGHLPEDEYRYFQRMNIGISGRSGAHYFYFAMVETQGIMGLCPGNQPGNTRKNQHVCALGFGVVRRE